jgi:RHS repeat-associated protein
LLYAGQYRDDESGLYYLRARYYDPGTAQFLTVDPAVATTAQPYGYVGDNPVNATDPTGMLSYWAVASWARRNAYWGDNGFPNDCADFASRALLHGGYPMRGLFWMPFNHADDAAWYLTWYQVVPWWGRWVGTWSWSQAPHLYSHLVNYRHSWVRQRSVTQVSPWNARAGDLIFADWGDGQGISHVGVIIATGLNGIQIAQHTYDRIESFSYWKVVHPRLHAWVVEPN